MDGKDIDPGFYIPPSKLRSPTQNDRVGLLLHLAPRSYSACRSLTRLLITSLAAPSKQVAQMPPEIP